VGRVGSFRLAAVITRMVSSSWLWTVWDMVIATVVATVAVQYRGNSPQDVLIGLAMAVALIARRHAPAYVMAAVSALAALQVFVCPSIPTGYDLAVLVAMTAVVTHARELWHAFVAGAIVAVGVVIVAGSGITDGATGSWFDDVYLGEYCALLVACAALWLFAYVLRTHRENAVVLADRAATAERERDHLARLAAADERAAIARELHDVVAHSLAVMIAQADGASYAIGQDIGRAAAAMRTVAGTGRDALGDMHRIVAVLRGTDPAEPEPDRRPKGLDQLETLVGGARAAGLAVDLWIDGEPRGLSAADELTVFRLAQEGLTNALRHAGPGAKVAVELRFAAGEAVVEVVDDGGRRAGGADIPGVRRTGGADAPEVRRTGGNGLIGMRERVAVHGGEFAAGPRRGPGWQVRAVIPIKAAA